MPDEIPPPKLTPKPYANGTDREPLSGVFHVRTGRTRRMVKWGAIIAAATTLLTPIMNAVASRIAPPQPVVVRVGASTWDAGR